MMHTVWIKGTVLAIKGYNLIRAVKVAKWAAAFANGTINGFYNVASTTFNKVNAFTIGFFGGFFGMFIGFGHPGAGAAFTTAYIKTGNALFDGKPFTWKDARSLAFSTVFSGAVGAFLGKGAEDGILRASEAFMIQFDIQLAEHVWGNLADAWRG
jgi:hypothetical protein